MPVDKYQFDVALSFAGEDRSLAEDLANRLREFRVRVFYDLYEQADLWGKDLYNHFQAVYRDRAKYCVIFVSHHYASKVWTKHEFRQAQERALKEAGDYILPLRVDDTDLPGLGSTVGYVDLRRNEMSLVHDLLLRKLFGDDYTWRNTAELTWRGELVPFRGGEVALFWPERLRAAQQIETYRIVLSVPRVRYGEETTFTIGVLGEPCQDCAAQRGEYHVPGCKVEQCPTCGWQAIGCGCEHEEELA